MKNPTSGKIDARAGEGRLAAAPIPAAAPVNSTASQVRLARRIRRRVNAEFDRVAASFRAIAAKQGDTKRAEIAAVIAILEDKRAEVMGRQQAAYFIHDWRTIGGQVRQMIFRDARYQAIKSTWTVRRR